MPWGLYETFFDGAGIISVFVAIREDPAFTSGMNEYGKDNNKYLK